MDNGRQSPAQEPLEEEGSSQSPEYENQTPNDRQMEQVQENEGVRGMRRAENEEVSTNDTRGGKREPRQAGPKLKVGVNLDVQLDLRAQVNGDVTMELL